MAIGDQFTGLDMQNLIGAPLTATADASVQLAKSTADFISTVGFDEAGNARTASFKFDKLGYNDDGTTNQEEMNVDVPLLAIVPIPNLQVDEVNILFDMEVKQSEKSESSFDLGASASVSAGFWGVKASITGSVAAHSANTRSTDNSAKYHVDVRAANHGTPEGLSRVLDMMSSNVAPSLVSSTALDENGKPLTGDRKQRNDKLKMLKTKKEKCDIAVAAAQKSFDSSFAQFKKLGQQMQNKYTATLTSAINSLKDNEKEQLEDLSKLQEQINSEWNTFQTVARDYIDLATASVTKDEGGLKFTDFTKLFVLGGVQEVTENKEENNPSPNVNVGEEETKKYKYLSYDDPDLSGTLENDCATMNGSYSKTVNASYTYEGAQQEATNASKEYNDLLCNNVI